VRRSQSAAEFNTDHFTLEGDDHENQVQREGRI
jgi:hypothetical protein